MAAYASSLPATGESSRGSRWPRAERRKHRTWSSRAQVKPLSVGRLVVTVELSTRASGKARDSDLVFFLSSVTDYTYVLKAKGYSWSKAAVQKHRSTSKSKFSRTSLRTRVLLFKKIFSKLLSGPYLGKGELGSCIHIFIQPLPGLRWCVY